MASVQDGPANRGLSSSEEDRTRCFDVYNLETKTETTKEFTRTGIILESDAVSVLEGRLDGKPCLAESHRCESTDDSALASLMHAFNAQVVLLTKLKEKEHSNIVKLLDHSPRSAVLFLENLPESLAMQKFKDVTLSTDDITAVVYDVCSALACLNEQGYCHNNIDPRHIFYSSDRGAVLSGFYKATEIEKINLDHLWGNYVPPEFLDPRFEIGVPVDVWALGINMLWYLFEQDTLYPLESPIQGSDIHSCEESLCEWESWLAVVADHRARLDGNTLVERIIRDMLDPDPETRITVSRVLEELKDWNVKRSRK